jgi:hypothetical protein
MELSSIKPTSLSVGATVRSALLADPCVARLVKEIAPLGVPAETSLPYIVYARGRYSQVPVKGLPGPDLLELDLIICTEDYPESILLAEAVRAALDGKQITPATPDMVPVRGCWLSGGDGELIDGDAVIQHLTFTLKI